MMQGLLLQHRAGRLLHTPGQVCARARQNLI
jgi:hypothetical protein